jgi:predicted dehydrogenase
MLEQATHAIDMMRFLCGDVAEVYTKRASRELKEIDCPDVHAVALSFKSGAVGALTATWAYDPRDWSHANIVSITYADKLLRWLGGAKAIVSGGGAQPEEHVREGKTIEEAFVQAVRTGDGSVILSPYSDAVKSLEVSLAINESGETGKVVKLKQ